MNQLKVISLSFCLIIFGSNLSNLVVHSKALLCAPPPKWTVNNGSDPMNESLGNVTLVTLMNASYRFGLKQATNMENMLRFLKNSGLKDIQFIVINAKDSDANQKLTELSNRVSFAVYQESESELVWNTLDGGKDDMFIYDRCGLLTYYIPFPLSIIHAQQPILQAALLSTYFDNPCGEMCDSISLNTTTITVTTTAANFSTESIMPFVPTIPSLSARTIGLDEINGTLEGLEESKDIKLTTNKLPDFKADEVFTFEDTIAPEGCDGSGSGDQPIEQSYDSSTELNDIKVEVNNETISEIKGKSKEFDKNWKILDFFNTNDNRSDKEIFDEIYSASINELELSDKNNKKVGETPIEVQTTTLMTHSPQDWTQTTISTTSEPTTSTKRTRISIFNSASRTKCETFNQTMCNEWSTDRLLRARLCCLTEVLADEDSGFGCGHFERKKCHRMLPLIKCCLKDFSQLLDNYFQSIRVTPRPSRERNN